jgi:hypothetical protein
MDIKVSGLKEIEKQLSELGSKTGTRILRASMLAANKPILEQAKANIASIQNGSGSLHQSMGARFFAGQKQVNDAGVPQMGGRFSVQTAPIRKNRAAIALHNLVYGRRRKGIFHGHLLEFGHKTVNGKQVPSRAFLRPALQSKGASAVALLAEQLRIRIDRQLRKNAKR